MKTVFIDSQIWLSLYDFSKDDLDQFAKLNDLIGKDIEIILTSQVKDEVRRNRENKIKESLIQFRNLNIVIPNLCKGYNEYITFKEIYRNLQTIHKELVNKIESDIEVEKLHADIVKNTIFEKVKSINRTDEIINQAKIRFDIGNPPGKNKSYGDSINWILLLKSIPEGNELFFISNDKDYRSVVNDERMNQFLIDEWKKIKKSDIYFYKSLTDFFNLHLKHIELKTENMKNTLIEKLRKSGAFNNTHSIISKLVEFTSWTDDQVIALLKTAESNSQVWGIIGDPDLKQFFDRLISPRIDFLLENKDLEWILRKAGYKNSSSDSDDEAPF
jgi:hypothetical protein